MLYSSINDYTTAPVLIRYPRGNSVGVEIKPMESLPLGKGEILRNGLDVCIIAIGKMVSEAMKAAELLAIEGISAEVVNARFVKPLDTELLSDIAHRFDKIITVEDGQIQGGFGSAVLEYVTTLPYTTLTYFYKGIPDVFVEHGTQEKQQFADLLLDGAGIATVVAEAIYRFSRGCFSSGLGSKLSIKLK